jgi:predicted AAA+ superfamily ATPase
MMKKRWIGRLLKRCLGIFPVVVVVGARQTGKTTLVRDLLGGPRRAFVTLDEVDALERAQRDPASLFERLPATFDEVQREPGLMLETKRQVDRARKPGMVLMTGSANLNLMKNVSDTLAGRAVYLELPPFSPAEWESSGEGSPFEKLFDAAFDPDDWPAGGGNWQRWLLRGGMAPAIEIEKDADRALWFAAYVQTYLERDLRQLSDVSSLPDYQRVMRLAANRIGRFINQSEIARDAGVKQPTTHRYLNLLETGFQICRIETFAANPNLPVVKAPRLFFTDGGIAAYLAGIRGAADLKARDDSGFWLEQAVFQGLLTWRSLDPMNRAVFTYRDRKQNEVDFVLRDEQHLVAVEVKAASRLARRHQQGLDAFEESLGRRKKHLVRKVILYGGSAPRQLFGRTLALPYRGLFPA